MQAATRIGTQADHIASVGRDFGLEKNDIDHTCIVAQQVLASSAVKLYFCSLAFALKACF